MPEMIGTLLNERYRLDAEIGRGGMGDVYRATDTQTGEPVAVKALNPGVVARDPDILERFIREGQALRQLNHPNIVSMVAAIEEEGQHYLIMEYIGGGSLQDLLAAQGPLPIARAVEIGLEVADALTRAHHLGIIHRDLKPANVLLAKDGTPRLTDFGIAHVPESPRLTQTGILMGTVDYLSPEACSGEALDTRADIWAFGVVLYEMLIG
jgi:serine/threonine-protein kinase